MSPKPRQAGPSGAQALTPRHPALGAVRLPKPSGRRPQEPLRAWHAHFALWLVEQPVTPGIAAMLEAANGFANARHDPRRSTPHVVVTKKMLRTLRERADFQGLVQEIEKGSLERARVTFLSHLPELVGLHVWAARTAQQNDDWRAMAPLTTPALDRALPRREAPLVAAQSISITLTPAQYAGFTSYEAPEVTCEVVEPTAEGDALGALDAEPLPQTRPRPKEITVGLGSIIGSR